MSSTTRTNPETAAILETIGELLAGLPLPVLRRVSAIVRQMGEQYARSGRDAIATTHQGNTPATQPGGKTK